MVRTRQKPAAETVLPVPPPLPGWTRPDAPVTDIAAAFQAGAARAALDARARADARAAPFAGAWRRRLALKAAARIPGPALLGFRQRQRV